LTIEFVVGIVLLGVESGVGDAAIGAGGWRYLGILIVFQDPLVLFVFLFGSNNSLKNV